ncbi:hypothetical protein OS493_006527 [Desmophyllum pertusum]|uniref:ShKT domain-containing protein n=1 Tax=Desmophyllum pertusum TaxID=174260 RepID=A0A9X0A4Z3_9CNID|nr:hypothetical protein OS493_006527 [Desmophyllum pertusum]
MSLKISKNTDYIDLFLIHTQQCDDFLLYCEEDVKLLDFLFTQENPKEHGRRVGKPWRRCIRKGKLRSLGVSNFDHQDLQELVELATVPVSAVQNWFEPVFIKTIQLESSAQSTTFGTLDIQLLSSLILEVASHYEFVPSQVVLRWAIHMNVTVIPRSKNPRNIYLNFRALDFSLNEDEIMYFTNITDYEYHPLEQKLDKGLGCADKHSNCEQWASAGECRTNPDWMLMNCQESCGLCFDEDLSDPSLAEPLVFVGSEDHIMYALNAASGNCYLEIPNS